MRLSLMFAIRDKPKNLDELRKELNKNPVNILRGLNELKEHNLIVKNDKNYSISVSGQLILLNIMNFFNSTITSMKHKEFFDKHYIDSLPPTFVRTISYWNNAELIKSDNVNFAKSTTIYLENISRSKHIKIILPIYSKMYMDTILDTVLDKSGTLEIITNDEIFNYLFSKGINENFVKLNELKKLKIYKTDEKIDLFLTSTDYFSSLFLFLEDRVFDDSSVLINIDQTSNKYVNSLFNHFKIYSDKMEI